MDRFKKYRKDSGKAQALSRLIQQAMFMYLRLMEGKTHFNIENPIPEGDKQYDSENRSVVVIFNATIHDPNCKSINNKFDVVTDGNTPLARKLCDDERVGLKRLAGRPKDIKTKKNLNHAAKLCGK